MFDIFCYIVPPKYKEAVFRVAPADALVRRQYNVVKGLTDLEQRFRIMDRYKGLVQVLSIADPAIHTFAPPKEAVEIARLANDDMAELVEKYPDRFIGAIATLPLNDMDATVSEAERAIMELGFRGVSMYTDVNGVSIDAPQFMPLYETMTRFNLPILLQPWRPASVPDYPTETRSNYRISLIFGWPYETSAAMTHLVFGGVLDKYPDLKIVTHHCGGMVPYFAGRIAGAYAQAEKVHGEHFVRQLKKPVLDYFRMFYADTAVAGNTAALMCGYDFFGPDHILFGSDMPFDYQLGDRNTRETIRAIERMAISESDKRRILEENARRVLRLPA